MAHHSEAWADVARGIRAAVEEPGGASVRGPQATPSRHHPASPLGLALHQLRAPPADFTGRQADLVDLRAKLGPGGAIIAGLTGQGGVGKTALALKLVQELARDYPDAQLEIDLRDASSEPLTAAAVMARAIRAFDPPKQSFPRPRMSWERGTDRSCMTNWLESVRAELRRHRQPKLHAEHAGPVAKYLLDHPHCTQAEVADFIGCEFHIHVDTLTLRRFFKAYGLSVLRPDRGRSPEQTHLCSRKRTHLRSGDLQIPSS